MSIASYQEQLDICRKTLESLDQAGAEITQLANQYTDLLQQMQSMGYTSELLQDLRRMEAEFQGEIEGLKRQLFDDNMQYIHRHGTLLKQIIAGRN